MCRPGYAGSTRVRWGSAHRAGFEDDDRALGRHGICAACLEELQAETGEPDDGGEWDY